MRQQNFIQTLNRYLHSNMLIKMIYFIFNCTHSCTHLDVGSHS